MRPALQSKLALVLPISVALLSATVRGAEPPCLFDEATLSFKGTPLEQAKCLLRPVARYGRLGEALAQLPEPLEGIIGKPVAITPEVLHAYLKSRAIAEADVGGPVTNHLSAKYFVIHDTSTPNYLNDPFPTNIDTVAWSHNALARWAKSPVAHVFVNRLGESLSPHTWVTPWRATKLEVRVLGEKARGLFVHTELVQPRRRDPAGGAQNDALSPDPGFTEAQLDRLALLYVAASVQHGSWMVPAFHAAVDAGIPNGHDDPQNFDLALWAQRLSRLLSALNPTASTPPRFEVSVGKDLTLPPHDGRLFVVITRTPNPEPRLTLGRANRDAPQALARDVPGFGSGSAAMLGADSFSFPLTNVGLMPPGDYFIQALFDSNTDLRSPNAPGNLYSTALKVHLPPLAGTTMKLELTHQIPAETVPPDTEELKFIKLPSDLLTRFHGRPMFLRASVVLPRDYDRTSDQRYPLWVRIGGLDTRYTATTRLMATNSDFRKTWLADNTPRFLLLQLDGAGPYGDPYYVNSANNGPYGDALVQELIPFVEAKFRALDQPRARVLSGVSTGGWVALALQVFYPDFFNGAWAACPDPVDFRALELVNIYDDDNAYVDARGQERPSERNAKGATTLTTRREIGVENLLGRGNSFTRSGQQWGDWNAVFSPRGADGLPVPNWDPRSGKIDHTVAEQWKKYDLRIILQDNWNTLAPKLRGKIHIAAGEADGYFLNNAVHLLDAFLAHADPPFEGSIFYGPGKGHGWSNLSLSEMLAQMQQAVH